MRTASASLLIFQHFLPLSSHSPPHCGDQSHKQISMSKPWFSQHLKAGVLKGEAHPDPDFQPSSLICRWFYSSRPSTRLSFNTAKQIPIFSSPPHCRNCLQHLAHPSRDLAHCLQGQRHCAPFEFLWSQAEVVTAAWGGGNFASLLWRASENIYLLFRR